MGITTQGVKSRYSADGNLSLFGLLRKCVNHLHYVCSDDEFQPTTLDDSTVSKFLTLPQSKKDGLPNGEYTRLVSYLLNLPRAWSAEEIRSVLRSRNSYRISKYYRYRSNGRNIGSCEHRQQRGANYRANWDIRFKSQGDSLQFAALQYFFSLPNDGFEVDLTASSSDDGNIDIFY